MKQQLVTISTKLSSQTVSWHKNVSVNTWYKQWTKLQGMQQIIICRPFIFVLWHTLITLLYLIQIDNFFINKLFYTFHTYFCLFLQFLHILFYFTTFLFFYIIIAPRKTFSYPWWCHSHIDWQKIRFSFLFKQLKVSHVQCLVSNILLKGNMNRSSNIWYFHHISSTADCMPSLATHTVYYYMCFVT